MKEPKKSEFAKLTPGFCDELFLMFRSLQKASNYILDTVLEVGNRLPSPVALVREAVPLHTKKEIVSCFTYVINLIHHMKSRFHTTG